MTTFIEAFDEVRRRNSSEIAVHELGQRTLTFDELWQQAEALARDLLAAGVGAESLIALEMPRSAEWVVGALGCWMAGAAFCPLSPAAPIPRRERLARRLGAAVSLVRPGEEASPAAQRTLEVVATTLERRASDSLPSPGEDALAYVIFTSGSTGRPKGVEVTHRGIVPMLRAQIACFDVGAGARCLWALSPGFDASISDVGVPLLSGATLVIDPAIELRDPTEVLERLGRAEITHADIPPALLPHMDPARAPATLRTVIVGGEAVDADAARRWSSRVRLVSVYGPTEATVCTSMAVCDAEFQRGALGTTVPGVEYRVEDGQLVIVGAAVARGYLDDLDLTAERFVQRQGRPAFKTGDRVERRADGLYFVGRIDRQVKVGGQLVAPEEVESVLRSAPGVTGARVVFNGGGARFEAFVEGEAELDVEAARLRARALLPPHLVPPVIRRVARLPTSDHGKVDESALCAAQSEREAHEGWLAWLVALALQMATTEVRLDRSFREHGGTSLAALEVASRAEAAGLGISVPRLLSNTALREALAPAPAGIPRSVASIHASVRARIDAIEWPRTARPRDEKRPRATMVTGATGLLGAHVLARLLASPTQRVRCLVRAADSEAAARRVRQAADRHGLTPPRSDRVRFVAGDLTRERFGLDESAWRDLADGVEAVIHLAGALHGAADPDELEAVNLGGTIEVLRLAIESGVPVTLASTLSIFTSASSPPPRVGPQALPRAGDLIHGVYDQSKLAAELAARALSSRVPAVRIVRYGLLQGSSGRQWLDRVARGIVRLESMPAEGSALRFDLTPVQYAAERTVATSRDRAPGLSTHHVAGATRLSPADLHRALCDAGAKVSLVPAEELMSTTGAAPQGGDPDIGACLLAFARALGPQAFARHRDLDLFEATDVAFEGRELASPELVHEALRAVAARAVAQGIST